MALVCDRRSKDVPGVSEAAFTRQWSTLLWLLLLPFTCLRYWQTGRLQ